jgi:predicted dehydrogenase
MEFRVGIVGCGNIFPMHAYPVQALKNCKLAAVCDNKRDRAEARAKEFDWGVSHIKQIDAFYQSLANGEKPFIDGHEALGTMKLVLGLYDSGRQKRRIMF